MPLIIPGDPVNTNPDRDTLRQRIAEVLWPLTDWDGDQLNAERAADAVLAVLPDQTGRAAVLLEVADFLRGLRATGTAATVQDIETELRRLAAEAQRECRASISGNCLRESQSETACDTEAGECVYGGQPAAEAPTTTKPPGVQPRHTCHDQKSAPGWDWECQWCSTLPDDISPAAGARQDGAQR